MKLAPKTHKSFVHDVFRKSHMPKLGIRKKTFKTIFETLEARNKSDYLIIETGCARTTESWDGDGQSTLMFDQFVNFYGGEVHTVDIDPENCAYTRAAVSGKTHVHCDDSVTFLWNHKFDRAPDLLYLDSFDLDVNNPHPSAFHHIKELLAIMKQLNDETLIVVDDNITDDIAKGIYINEFMTNIGATQVFKQYQVAWYLKPKIHKPGFMDIFRKPLSHPVIESNSVLILRVNNYNDILNNWAILDAVKEHFNSWKITAIVDPDDKTYGLLKCDDRIRDLVELNPRQSFFSMLLNWHRSITCRDDDVSLLLLGNRLQAVHLRYLLALMLCPNKKYLLLNDEYIKPFSIKGCLVIIQLTAIKFKGSMNK